MHVVIGLVLLALVWGTHERQDQPAAGRSSWTPHPEGQSLSNHYQCECLFQVVSLDILALLDRNSRFVSCLEDICSREAVPLQHSRACRLVRCMMIAMMPHRCRLSLLKLTVSISSILDVFSCNCCFYRLLLLVAAVIGKDTVIIIYFPEGSYYVIKSELATPSPSGSFAC